MQKFDLIENKIHIQVIYEIHRHNDQAEGLHGLNCHIDGLLDFFAIHLIWVDGDADFELIRFPIALKGRKHKVNVG